MSLHFLLYKAQYTAYGRFPTEMAGPEREAHGRFLSPFGY